MLDIHIENGDLPQEEIDAYVAHMRAKYPTREIYAMDIRLEGEEVALKCYFRPRFQHVYRATDYLVKSLDVLNDAKRAEFADKVAHSVD